MYSNYSDGGMCVSTCYIEMDFMQEMVHGNLTYVHARVSVTRVVMYGFKCRVLQLLWYVYHARATFFWIN